MEKKSTLAYVLVSLLIISLATTSALSSPIRATTSSSSEEDEETTDEDTELTEEEEATSSPMTETQRAMLQAQQQTLLPIPPEQSQPTTSTTPSPSSNLVPSTVPTTTGTGVTAQELIQKYGANRTINLPGGGGGAAAVSNVTGDKAVILTFDDNWLSQYTFAAPLLENNKMNATYFVYCLGVDQGPAFMTADEVRDLDKKGFDIESHSMTHPDLTHMSDADLNFEITESKQCLQDMVPGLNVTVFATPFALGADNATILDKIAETFEFARVGYGENFNIQCNGWYVPDNQTAGCQLREPGTNQLKVQSRYNMPTLDVNSLGRENNHDLNATQTAFINLINDALTYDNETGKVVSVPILVYHNFTNRLLPAEEMGQSLLAESFAQQMQYLKDNGFIGLSIRDLQWHPDNQTFTIPRLDELGYTSASGTTNGTTTTGLS